jgi:hypothetical protein
MKQIDEKERPEYELVEHEQGSGQVLKVVNKPGKDNRNKENKKANLIFEEIQQKLKEAQEAKQRIMLATREAQLRLTTDKTNEQTANLTAQKAKVNVSIAIERAKQIEQKAFKARQKEREAEKRSQRANLEAEEALHKLQEAEENRRLANFALEESKQKVQVAEEDKRKANFVVEEFKLKERYLVEEAKQKVKLAAKETKQKNMLVDESKESDKSEVVFKQSAFDAKIISPDNKEILYGPLNLSFNPGAQGSKIVRLIVWLSSYSEMKIVSIDKFDDTGSRIELFVKKPMPLYQVLYGLPFVQQIVGKGNELLIALRPEETQ